MSAQVVTQEYNALLSSTPVMVLAANPARAYLQIQNKSAVAMQYKFGPFVAPASAVQTGTPSAPPTGGTFQVTVLGQTTAPLQWNASAATIQTAVQALSSVGANNLAVSGTLATALVFTFEGALGNLPIAAGAITINASGLSNNVVQSNAIQAINFSQPPTAGTFNLSFLGQATGELPFNISAANLMIALNLLSTINGAVTAVAQDGTTKDFSVTFGGAPLAGTVVPLIVVVDSSLTGSANQATQVQTLSFAPLPVNGTFQLSDGADVTAALPFNANATQVQNALEILPLLGVGNVLVTGSMTLGFTITYQGALVNVVAPVLFVVKPLLLGAGIPDDLDAEDGLEADDWDKDTVAQLVTVTTTGHGTDVVAVTVLTTMAGATPGAVTVPMVVTTGGTAGQSGIDLPSGNPPALFDAECPIDALWMSAAAAGSAVTVLEG